MTQSTTRIERTRVVSGTPRPSRARRHSVASLLEAYAMVVVLLAVALFFTLYGATADTFPTSGNLRAVVGNQSVLAIVALAALIPLVCNGFDLSVGATAGVAAVFSASAMSSGTPTAIAVGVGVGIGLAVGVVNAFVVTVMGVNAVIATLGMATILTGVITMKTGGVAVVSNIPDSVTNFGSKDVFGFPYTGFALLIVAVAVHYVLRYTPFGRYAYALGSSPQAAKLVGLKVRRTYGSSFVVAGGLAAMAGVLQVARAGGADPRVGESFTLPALAAAFLSAAVIKPGVYNVGGVITAIFFLATINSGLNLAGAQPYVSSYVNGAALIGGVGLAAYFGRRRKR